MASKEQMEQSKTPDAFGIAADRCDKALAEAAQKIQLAIRDLVEPMKDKLPSLIEIDGGGGPNYSDPHFSLEYSPAENKLVRRRFKTHDLVYLPEPGFYGTHEEPYSVPLDKPRNLSTKEESPVGWILYCPLILQRINECASGENPKL